MDSKLDILQLIDQGKKHRNEFIGRAKILASGKTGVGKSSLINAVFGKETCETGSGKPVTQYIQEFRTDDSLVTLIDSKGLELATYKDIEKELVDYIGEMNRSENPHEHVRLCWLCIDYQGRRIEEAEINLCNKLKSMSINVIIVLTKYFYPIDVEFEKVISEQFKDLKIVKVNSSPVMNEETGETIFPIKNIKELIEVTNRLIPDAQRNAFIAAQKVDFEKKRERCNVIIHTAAAAAAAAAGVNPLPIPDAVIIIPIQIGMFMSINTLFGIGNTDIKNMLAPILGPLALGYAGPQAVAFFSKFVPGIGTIAGGLINATVATALTEAAGQSYLKAISMLLESGEARNITPTDIAKSFSAVLSKLK